MISLLAVCLFAQCISSVISSYFVNKRMRYLEDQVDTFIKVGMLQRSINENLLEAAKSASSAITGIRNIITNTRNSHESKDSYHSHDVH